MWDVVSKEVLQRVEGHNKGVCFWVDVKGDTMVTAGQDCTVRVYKHRRTDEQPTNGLVNGEGKDGEGAAMELPIRQEDVKMEDS